MQEDHLRRRKSTLGSFHESLFFVSVQSTDILSDHNEKLNNKKKDRLYRALFLYEECNTISENPLRKVSGKEKWNLGIVNGLLHTLQTKTQLTCTFALFFLGNNCFHSYKNYCYWIRLNLHRVFQGKGITCI